MKCSYCGREGQISKDHVFPKCLYPKSRRDASQELLTIPACVDCNNGWSNDEAHFRNVIVVSGDPNPSVNEIWKNKVKESFGKRDGIRRLRELRQLMNPIQLEGKERFIIYPGRDERVLRVTRKIVRGLSHFHEVGTAIPDARVWADVMTYEVPDYLEHELTPAERVPEVASYRYAEINDHGIESAWLITLYERTTFIGLVSSEQNGLF